MSHLKTFLYLRYIMLGMRSALSTIETKQVNYQIFICIFFLWVTSPHMGIRLWDTEGRLCLPCHIHSYTSSTRLLNKTNICNIYFFKFNFSNTLPSVLREGTCNVGEKPQIQWLEMLSITDWKLQCLFNYNVTSRRLTNKHLHTTFSLWL